MMLTPAHGFRATIIAGATAVAGDHSVLVACITASAGVAAVVIGPLVSSWIRSRRPALDHKDEVIAEQRTLVEHLVSELSELRGEKQDQENELRRLRRRRD